MPIFQNLREALKCWKAIQFWEAPKFWMAPNQIFGGSQFFLLNCSSLDSRILLFINQNGIFFLKAFVETRNLRCWKAKSEQFTSSDKNHSQFQVTQSHFLTLSDVWHTMAYVFLNAFAETRNLRCWEAKSEQFTSSDKNHSQTQVTQSHFLTLSDVWQEKPHDILERYCDTEILRYWQAKLER